MDGEQRPNASRPISSKYDFVKVRVWLQDHYYTFSRFLVSRVLSVTKVSYADSLKISLALKKALVDEGLLDVTQADMENWLFFIMRSKGYGDEYMSRYRMMTHFNHQRIPLVILVCGTGCIGKSTISTQLAERLNLSAVLQSDLVYEVMKHTSVDPAQDKPRAMYLNFDSKREFLEAHGQEAELVRGGLSGELDKVMADGKTIIIEGSHLDPSQFQELADEAAKRKEEGLPFVFVPFTLTALPADHKIFLDNFSHHNRGLDMSKLGSTSEQVKTNLESNLGWLDEHLQQRSREFGFTVLGVSVHSFGEILDAMHTKVLDNISIAVEMQRGGGGSVGQVGREAGKEGQS